MMGKFEIRNLMVNVVPEDDQGCEAHKSYVPGTNCAGKSCRGFDCRRETFKPQTNCDRPTCKELPQRRDEGLDELARSNLALLQKELRRALVSGL